MRFVAGDESVSSAPAFPFGQHLIDHEVRQSFAIIAFDAGDVVGLAVAEEGWKFMQQALAASLLERSEEFRAQSERYS